MAERENGLIPGGIDQIFDGRAEKWFNPEGNRPKSERVMQKAGQSEEEQTKSDDAKQYIVHPGTTAQIQEDLPDKWASPEKLPDFILVLKISSAKVMKFTAGGRHSP
ncbi:hypothetical protein D3H55_08025 [Bacillus salacetis]|uniref:Uncharacterized protein n=1 Tax=Bacillus salacetis TaxID=2315464 RepID=A0A3A1R154_9BACI|nr:hypothetical protein [Bacillus salacetis]RIW35333.1 hypothetical protein D3H55_08025 [Bacillus salacetis]